MSRDYDDLERHESDMRTLHTYANVYKALCEAATVLQQKSHIDHAELDRVANVRDSLLQDMLRILHPGKLV